MFTTISFVALKVIVILICIHILIVLIVRSITRMIKFCFNFVVIVLFYIINLDFHFEVTALDFHFELIILLFSFSLLLLMFSKFHNSIVSH